MADKKISELPLLNSVSGSSLVIPIVHDGTTVKLNLSQLGRYASQWSAQTGSANTFTGTQSIIGNVNISGKLSVNSIEAVYETSSILYTSGSTQIGDQSTDVHTIFGTIILNGLALGTSELMAQTASQAAVNLGISSVTGSINTTTSSFDSVFLRISSTTGSINTTTSSFDSVFLRISSTTGSINTTTSSFDSVFLRISSTTGSINTTTSSFDSVFLGISSTTGSINTTTSSFDSVFLGISSFTGSLNSISGSYATTGSNTFRGNQNITGSLSISAGEFNVTTGSGNMTSSLIFDHTQNDGVTLGLRHNDRLSLADHTLNTQVWAGGVYTTFVRNGVPYSILNVEAFDDNKIYLYRDTRLYNKSLVIDNNLTVQNGIVIGSGSLSIQRGQFNAVTGSGALTSSLSFTHTEVDPITGNGTLELRYRNNQVGSENNAWKFVATDNGVQVRYDQYTTSNKMLFSVSSFGSNFDKLLIWRDVRLFGTGLTVDDSLLVKGVITGSILATNGVVSSSNQLFELNVQTGSQDLVNLGISSVTGSINTTTSSFNSVFLGISSVTGSINTTTSSFNSVFLGISSVTGAINTTTSSFNSVFLGISSVTGSINTTTSSFNSVFSQIGSTTASLIGITNGLMAFTAALDNTYATDAQLYQLYQATASIHSATASLNTETGSQANLNAQIGIATSSLNTFSGSIRSEINLLEAFTASLKAVAIVSSSTQIQNYNVFALTASANTFWGTQTFSGSLNLSGSMQQTGLSTIIGNTVLSGSIAMSGSTIQTGNNTLIGNTVLSGSILVSGSSDFKNSEFRVTGSSFFTGSHTINGNSTFSGSINIASGSSYYRAGNKLFNYGQWGSLETQSGSANTAYPIKLATQMGGSEGISVANNGSGFPTRITVENTGLYNIGFSLQLHTTANEACDFSVWFAMTGSNIANSNTDFSIEKVTGGGFQVAALNLLAQITAGDYIELYYSKTTANGQLQAKTTQSTPTRPATPSAIVTITQHA